MKHALSEREIDRLNRAGRDEPIEGTYGAIRREDFPTLMNPSLECNGAILDRAFAQNLLDQAEDAYRAEPSHANKCRVICQRMYLALFIEESETVQ